ncbi:tetratricopeptide repeat protein [Actinomadura algeriensis]|uniref:Tetratricopeptide repeat protein n=1 Tax=Actinomadura algeriensis TaxID=1679523 RepID=A0ABR9K401_9ACTN|nr:tetratricopeptide repeat protein [Actinomadura algeriensis]MBE1537581.1 hypothetical protein [Actinomadura algeriensis]
MSFGTGPHSLNRRAFLRTATLAVAAGTAASLWESTPSAASAVKDPDLLFKAGSFAAAERGYRHALHNDPGDVHALAQIGYIALLSNRFADAEKYLSKAIAARPDDVTSAQRLAECFVRQDRLPRATPLLRGTGRPRDTAFAELYSQVTGTPWRVRGARSTRVPFVTLDPVPAVEASVNGGRTRPFWLDTYATLDLSLEAAEDAGLRAVATVSGGVANNRPITIWLGVMDSFRIGDIEIRNIPVQWSDAKRPSLPDGTAAAGAFGTTLFYHFLTTMDYAGRALILRRGTAGPRRTRATDRLPLWLAGDHYPCTLGSLGDYGPRMVTIDTGGIGTGFDTTVEIAERAGLAVDYDRPLPQPAGKLYPVTADRIGLGGAIGHGIPGHAVDKVFPGLPGPGQSAQFGFDLIANFTHEFFKPFAVTFDYGAMHLSITTK